jgi:NTP pyrophosphatase (non-canonical NTP hydrolase)
MRFNEYQRDAILTANTELKEGERLANWCMGLAGETGELVDLMKKTIYHGHDYVRETVVKELGDILWYLALLANDLGITLDEIAVTNLSKLKGRYPEGFSKEKSINRKESDV